MPNSTTACDWPLWKTFSDLRWDEDNLSALSAHIPPITANPDIAGEGVLIGFVATGYLTLFLVVIYYIFGFVEVKYLNNIDRAFLHHTTRIFKPRWTARRASTLRKAVLMYSDQQLVTGIALLVSGYSQLLTGLDTYHWQILVYLVWFSSLTHLTTLTVLRQYLRDNPAIRFWRTSFMLLIVIMLGVALVPTGNSGWFLTSNLGYGGYGSILIGIPVRCYFASNASPFNDYYSLSSMILSLFVLFFGYSTRLVKLSNRATAFTKYWLRTAPGTIWKKWMARCRSINNPIAYKLAFNLLYMMMEIIYVSLHGWLEILESMLWEILWLALALCWGTWRLVFTALFSIEGNSSVSDLTASEERFWGFGQIFPVILLILPLFSIWESFAETFQRSPVAQIQGSSEHINDEKLRIETLRLFLGDRGATVRMGQWHSRSPIMRSSQLHDNIPAERRLESQTPVESTELSAQQGPESATTMLRSSPPSNSQTPTMNGVHLPPYHQLEWFHLLIAMMILLSCGTAYKVICTNGNLLAGISILQYILIMITATTFYAVIFVTLSHIHGSIGDFLEYCFRIPRSFQHKSLRGFGYFLALGIIGFGIMTAVLFI